ncbi:MAG TPA: cytochrome P450 [Acidimicrobiia bacterium]|nr:cytochrome P450 [Acidimicrobiia bacterium]
MTRHPERLVSVDELATDPHPVLASLRRDAPVAWIPDLEAWLVTTHALCTEVMLDADTFTVDDPRFSTQQVIGPSMLSLDGVDHRRHRDPFAPPFRAAAIAGLRTEIEAESKRLVATVAAEGGGDLRSMVAAPLAVSVMAGVLDLGDVTVSDVLAWYQDIVEAVHVVTAGGAVPRSGLDAFESLKAAVSGNMASSRLLGPVDEAGSLGVDEIVSNVAVLLFGGIVTSESSTAIAFHHLIADPRAQQALREDRSKVKAFVEETFRIEPSAAAVDRYATRDVDLAGARIQQGDLVRVSLSAANRDPAVFHDPDRLDWDRDNLGRNLTFARGPHACLGIHLARLETAAAVDALLDEPTADLHSPHLAPVEGLVFRVPATVDVTWPGSASSPK